MNSLKLISHIICNKKIFYNAIKIAAVVGIILNLINQGEYLIHLDFEHVNFFKLGLTFLVPFCVSSYTAISMKMKYHVGEKSIATADLVCRSCNKLQEVKKDEIIPFCINCKGNTLWKVKKIKDGYGNCGN